MEGKIELPRDVNGVPIKIGDTVYYSGRTVTEELKVTALICYGEKWLVRCERVPNVWNDWEPRKLTHVPPDNLESIKDAINWLVYYARRMGLDLSEEEVEREISDLMKRIKTMMERER